MSKTLSVLMLALVLLGFLISTTMNMYGDMELLKAENQKLSAELTQLRSNYEAISQERDIVQAENADLQMKLEALQNTYQAENEARLKAESQAAAYKGMILNMARNVQTVSPSACIPAEQQTSELKPGELILSNIAPVGAGSLVTLVMASLVGTMTKRYRMQRKSKNLATRLKDFR